MSICRWVRRLLHRERGYWICPDDWQGINLLECEYVNERLPVHGVTVYYRSAGELKPYRKVQR